MQLTLAGEYAIRAMIHIASESYNNIFHISDISKSNNIPEMFLRKIIPKLKSKGLIRSTRGNGGGIMLGKSASQITLLEIIEAVEGEMALNKCLIDKAFCSNNRWCAVHILWCEAQKNLKNILSSKSIKELALDNIERKKKLIPLNFI